MRSDKYKNRENGSSYPNDSWEETQLLFQNRDREKKAQHSREEYYEEKRSRDAIYQEYLAMRRNPDANRSPAYDTEKRQVRSSAYDGESRPVRRGVDFNRHEALHSSEYERDRQRVLQQMEKDALAKERVKKKQPILNDQPDRYEKKEQRQNKAKSRREREYEEYMRIRQEEAASREGSGRGRRKKKKKRGGDEGGRGRKKGRIKVILALLVLMIAAAAIGGFMFMNSMLSKVGDLDIDKSNLGIDSQVAEDLDNYRNIALLGVDARDMDDYANCRADAIIIMSIDKENKEIRQISVYRDTYLYIDETYKYNKITNVHSNAGTEATIRTLNKNMDLNIEEVVIVNWKSVADAIDGLGGIEIEILDSEVDELNKITLHTQSIIGGSKDTIDGPGLQTLNGNQAVAYSRIRKDSAQGDYRRNERMKIMLAATINKAKRTNPIVLNEIANDVLPQVLTNMDNKDMMSVMFNVMKMEMTGSTGWPFEVTGWSSNAWYGVPDTLESNVIELHELYFGQSGYVVTDTVEQISKNISYKTGIY